MNEIQSISSYLSEQKNQIFSNNKGNKYLKLIMKNNTRKLKRHVHRMYD